MLRVMSALDEPTAGTTPDPLALFQRRALLDALEMTARASANVELADAVAALHNQGRIDALEMATWPTLAELPSHKAHFLERFLTLLLPDLDAPTAAMLDFVTSMSRPERRSSHLFLDGVVVWMRRRPIQARAVLDLAVQGDAQALPMLSIVLQGLGDYSAARTIIAAHDDERRMHAIHALGRIPHPDPAALDGSVTVLGDIPRTSDDQPRAQILEALAHLFQQAAAAMTGDAVILVKDLLAGAGDLTRHQAARALYQAAVFGHDATEALLDGLMFVNPDNAGTVETLDFALSDMIQAGAADLALDFLARLIAASNGAMSLSRFESVLNTLLTGPHARLADATVDWLLSGQASLARGVTKAIQRVGGTPVVLAPDLTSRGFSGPRLVSLARKAIGYFQAQPVTAASLVLAALRVVPRGSASEIETLLFETLLVHYGGALETYLKELPKADPAYRAVRRALKRKADYVRGLQAPNRIAELRPSEQKRRVEYERHAEEMRHAFEEARKASRLLNLFPTTVMLYGRQSMSFMVDFDGRRQSTDVKLQSHGTTVEIPRGAMLDPMGLEEMTLVFRAEPAAP